MEKQVYGQGTIKKLRDSGYSSRAIEDITFLAGKHRARTGKVEEMLSQGYTPARVDEIYRVAREFKQNPKKIGRFYDHFKNEGKLSNLVGCLANAVRESSNGDLTLYKAIPFAVNSSCKYGRDFVGTLENLEEDFKESQFYAKGYNRFSEYGEFSYEEEPLGEVEPEPESVDEISCALTKELNHKWGFE